MSLAAAEECPSAAVLLKSSRNVLKSKPEVTSVNTKEEMLVMLSLIIGHLHCLKDVD